MQPFSLAEISTEQGGGVDFHVLYPNHCLLQIIMISSHIFYFAFKVNTVCRVLISSYLFLTGYTHFSHYWRKGTGGSVTKFLQVLFRMNFLTFALCLCMNRPYQFYYFVPLVSFWYLGKCSCTAEYVFTFFECQNGIKVHFHNLQRSMLLPT